MSVTGLKSYPRTQAAFDDYHKHLLDAGKPISKGQADKIGEHFKLDPAAVEQLRAELLARSAAASEQAGQSQKKIDAGTSGQTPIGTPKITGIGARGLQFGMAADTVAQPRAQEVATQRAGAVAEGSLQEGVRYMAKSGRHGIGGKVFLEKKDGVVHITMPIAFIGAGLFSRVDDEVASKWGIKTPPEALRSKKPVRSFEEVPALKEHLLGVCREIEASFDTPYAKLHLDVRMPDELAFLQRDEILASIDDPIADQDEKWDGLTTAKFERYTKKADHLTYRSALSAGAQEHPDNGEVMSVIIDSMPDPRLIRPTLWNFGDSPVLLAHEVGHLLGIGREGYVFNDYPIDGLMTDEYGALALKEAFGETPKLSRSDLYDMLRNLAPDLDPPVTREAVDQEFSDTRGFSESVLGYETLPHAEKLALAKQRAERLKRDRAPQSA